MRRPASIIPLKFLTIKLTMRKDELISAGVKLKINGREIISRTKGVGPVDATLSAIKAETDKILTLEVKNHEVEILSPDTDSLVIVTLTLEKDGHQWTAKGASPDTVEAAIKAFEKGFAIAVKSSKE